MYHLNGLVYITQHTQLEYMYLYCQFTERWNIYKYVTANSQCRSWKIEIIEHTHGLLLRLSFTTHFRISTFANWRLRNTYYTFNFDVLKAFHSLMLQFSYFYKQIERAILRQNYWFIYEISCCADPLSAILFTWNLTSQQRRVVLDYFSIFYFF